MFSFFKQPISFIKQCVIIIPIAVLPRLLSYYQFPYMFGDGITYARLSNKLANGQLEDINWFWFNLSCITQTPFHWLFSSPNTAAIACSFFFGITLILSVIWTTRQLFSIRASWIAGLIILFHPRMIEYSTTGYSETLFLTLFTIGIGGITSFIKNQKTRYLAIWIIGFSLYFCIRQESIIFFAATAFLLKWKQYRKRVTHYKPLQEWLFIILLWSTIIGVYIITALHIGDAVGLFQKLTNLSFTSIEKNFTEAGQPMLAPPASLTEYAIIYIKRMLNNASHFFLKDYWIKVILTPLFIFIFYFFQQSKKQLYSYLPLISMWALPILFFSAFIIEPRYLFPGLIPLAIFSAAGIDHYFYKTRYIIKYAIVILIVSPAMLTSAINVLHLKKYGSQIATSSWLKAHIPQTETIYGDGFGFIAYSAFYSGHHYKVRPVAKTPETLIQVLRQENCKWLVIYEEYVSLINPEIKPILTQKIEGISHYATVPSPYSPHRAFIFKII